VVSRLSDLLRDAEADLDEVTQIGFAIGATDLAEEVSSGRGERLKALNDVAAARAHVVPFHPQETDLAPVEEEIDQSRFLAGVALRERDRVDTHQFFVARCSQERLEYASQVTRPGKEPGDLIQLRRKQPFIDVRHVRNGRLPPT
jgi:hypothetical protein